MNKQSLYVIFLMFCVSVPAFSTATSMEKYMRSIPSHDCTSDYISYDNYEDEPLDDFSTSENILSQLPQKEQELIRNAVLLFSINKQKMFLEFRPILEQTTFARDSLRLELTILLAQETNQDVIQDKGKTLIKQIIRKEQEIVNLQQAKKKNLENIRGIMRKNITKIINSWLTSTSVITESSLIDLFKEAERNYDRF